MQKRSFFIAPWALSIFVVLLFLLFHSMPVLSETYPSQVITLSGKRIFYSGLATADFNNDGYKEIVAGGSDGILYVLSTADGSNWSTVWSRQCNLDIEAANPPTHRFVNEIASAPAIADLDKDGRLEIIVAMGGDIHVEDINDRENGGVLVYHFNGAWDFSLIESLSQDGSRGWPQPRIDSVGKHPGFGFPDGLWDGIMTTPAIGDLDGDGDLEIVVAGIDRRIHAWHHTGEAVAGWPIYRYEENGIDPNDALLRGGLSSPALGDLNNDGKLDVVVATMSAPWDMSQKVSPTNPNYDYATLWAFNGDSTVMPGYPVATEQIFTSSPALGDIDKDGFLEIVIGTGGNTLPGRQNLVWAYNHDGTLLPNWPRETQGPMPGSPSLADIDKDGALEVIIGCGTKYWPTDCGNGDAKLYAWNADGSNVSGFPTQPESATWWTDKSYSMPFEPIVADYDGDGTLDILITQTGSWGVTLVGANGVTKEKREINIDQSGLFSPPLIDDIDNDGFFEILAGGGSASNGMIFIWDESGSRNSAQPWPMSRQNLYRIGGALSTSMAIGGKGILPVYLLLLH